MQRECTTLRNTHHFSRLCYNLFMTIVQLSRTHAADAARLHIAGQPGTFLTSLGPSVLTVFYQALPQSPAGFGFAAIDDSSRAALDQTLPVKTHNPISPIALGFVSATTSVGALFMELGTRRIGQFLPPLFARFARQPALILRSVQTLRYPFLVRAGPDHHTGATAELLSIMVEPAMRSQGIGTQLMTALLAECRQRQIQHLDVTVDTTNAAAQRFYIRHGFSLSHKFVLYGREMGSYRLGIQ